MTAKQLLVRILALAGIAVLVALAVALPTSNGAFNPFDRDAPGFPSGWRCSYAPNGAQVCGAAPSMTSLVNQVAADKAKVGGAQSDAPKVQANPN